MYPRLIEPLIKHHSEKYRCITLIGPRQSGKTTVCRKLFPMYEYFTFESPDVRERFLYDPRGFLTAIKTSAVFDEVQKVPKLLSYLQEILDDPQDTRTFILTGSNNLQLSNKVSQTLAGRTKILHLLPLQRQEIPQEIQFKNLEQSLIHGSYPRVYHEQLNPTDWYGDYLNTYVEKDIRDTINIMNLRSFDNFLRLLAGRVGQIMSYNSLGGDAGITQPTTKTWISALETSYICFVHQPHFKHFNKRITKSPKIYFYDTGLLCYLLKIKTPEQLQVHPLKGAVFENWVIAEYMKHYRNMGEEPPLYFWRDQHGHEVDLIIDHGLQLETIEIKSSMTFKTEFLHHINWLNELQVGSGGTLVYGGDECFTVKDTKVVPWTSLFPDPEPRATP